MKKVETIKIETDNAYKEIGQFSTALLTNGIERKEIIDALEAVAEAFKTLDKAFTV